MSQIKWRYPDSEFWNSPEIKPKPYGAPERVRYSDALVDTFRVLTKAYQSQLIVEIGAHEATFSIEAAKANPEADCIALEANPYVYERHFKLFEAHKTIRYLLCAATDRTGIVDIHVPLSFSGVARRKENRMGSLLKHKASEANTTLPVPAIRMDELVSIDDRRTVIWIDVEGAAGTVLRGAEKILPHVGAIFVELENLRAWINQEIDSEIIESLTNVGLTPFLRDCERVHQYNAIFVNTKLVPDSVLQEALDVFAKKTS